MTPGGQEQSLQSPDGIEPDLLLGGRVKLAQPKRGYRAAIDPILLAASLSVRSGERVLDLGCGAGAAALCLAARCPAVEIVGLEREPELLAFARQNATANKANLQVLAGDLRSPPAALVASSFDQIMCNPPYHSPRTTRPSPEPLRRAANTESDTDLGDWMAAAIRLLKPRGRLTVVQRADRLGELFARLEGSAGEFTVFPLWPREGQSAKRIILRARKGVATPGRLLAGLILHGSDGAYTAKCDAVLRRGKALDFA